MGETNEDQLLGHVFLRKSMWLSGGIIEVGPIWPHFGVLIGEAAQTPGSIVLASPSNGHDHIDYRDARWGLVCLPNAKDLPAQQCCKLSGHIVS